MFSQNVLAFLYWSLDIINKQENSQTEQVQMPVHTDTMTRASLKNHELFILKIRLSRKISHNMSAEIQPKKYGQPKFEA